MSGSDLTMANCLYFYVNTKSAMHQVAKIVNTYIIYYVQYETRENKEIRSFSSVNAYNSCLIL